MAVIFGLNYESIMQGMAERDYWEEVPEILGCYPLLESDELKAMLKNLITFCFPEGFHVQQFLNEHDPLCKYEFNHMICTDS
jgi:hypothetical protein